MTVGLKLYTAIALLVMAPWWSTNNALRLTRVNSLFRFSDKRIRQFSQTSQPSATSWKSKTSLGAKKKANEEPNPTAPAGWTTIKYGTPEDEKNREMEDRLREAERWVSKKLTDKESQELNRAMGIEAEVLAAIADEEDELLGKKKQKQSGNKQGDLRNNKSAAKLKLKEFLTTETRDAAKVKGFLELNPYICSGCGTPFQSKSTDSPGFLPKDKIKVHLSKAQKIRDKQEAIKILEMAGIEMDSEAAESILRDANISDDVIQGVRALSRGQNQADQRERDMKAKIRSGRSEYEMQRDRDQGGDDEDDEDDDEEYYDDDEEYEGEDALDGMEIDLEDLMKSTGDDADGSVINALKKSISEGLTRKGSNSVTDAERDNEIEERLIELQLQATAARGLAKDTKMYINDIDDELTGKKSNYRFTNVENLPQDGAIPRSNKESSLTSSKQLRMKGADVVDLRKAQYIDVTGESTHIEAEKRGRMEAEGEAVMTQGEFEKSVIDDSICICQRCFKLQQYGTVEDSLRPGWSEHELLTPERFESLLGSIRESQAVVLCIVDVFDLRGSILANLKQIAGTNPIVIAANKVDLLPKDVSSVRLTNWIHAEVKEFCDLRSPKEVDDIKRQEMVQKGWHRPEKGDDEGLLRRSNVHLVSCQAGSGMNDLMTSLMGLAADNGNKVYVMGAANVGKSSFINRLLESDYKKGSAGADRGSGGRKQKDSTPQATVSNLPGTTLNFLKIKLPNGVTMIDTPGLINRGQLTSKLTTEELRQVIPAKPINAVTLRVTEGKCVLIGGLAIIEHQEGKPFFFTFFISNEVKLHPTDSLRAKDFIARHMGGLLTPPNSPERYAELGPFKESYFEVEGDEWRKASTDVVIAGLGWISITGPGVCKIKVTAPEGTDVGLRSPLLPFEASHTTGKFTGGRLLKRSKKGGDKAYGWRA